MTMADIANLTASEWPDRTPAPQLRKWFNTRMSKPDPKGGEQEGFMYQQKIALILASILALTLGFALGRELKAQVSKGHGGMVIQSQ
jgi:hypothetical protein